jgi:AcrR family transcriptional regulator
MRSAKQTRSHGNTKTTRRSGPADRARVRLDVDERRAQLVELGLGEFGSRSYDDVSIDLIAQSAGISKGLLYHYFPTKRAFYLACVREAAGRLLARMDIADDVPPLERLTVGLDRYLDYVRAHGPAFATLMRSGGDRELAAIVDETRGALLDRLTSGMTDVLPESGLASPLLAIALQGWVGLAETMSIAWVERCIEAEGPHANAPAPPASEVRDLLAKALATILNAAVR